MFPLLFYTRRKPYISDITLTTRDNQNVIEPVILLERSLMTLLLFYLVEEPVYSVYILCPPTKGEAGHTGFSADPV